MAKSRPRQNLNISTRDTVFLIFDAAAFNAPISWDCELPAIREALDAGVVATWVNYYRKPATVAVFVDEDIPPAWENLATGSWKGLLNVPSGQLTVLSLDTLLAGGRDCAAHFEIAQGKYEISILELESSPELKRLEEEMRAKDREVVGFGWVQALGCALMVPALVSIGIILPFIFLTLVDFMTGEWAQLVEKWSGGWPYFVASISYLIVFVLYGLTKARNNQARVDRWKLLKRGASKDLPGIVIQLSPTADRVAATGGCGCLAGSGRAGLDQILRSRTATKNVPAGDG